MARQLNEAISRLDARLSQISNPAPTRQAQMQEKQRQHRQRQQGRRQQIEHAAIHGRLSEPHAFRLAAEAMLKIRDAPADLRARIALTRKGYY